MSTLNITASKLNLRQTPSKDAPVLLQLPQGFRVVALGASPDGSWYQVQAASSAGPVTGWIVAQYATAAAAAPAPAAPATAAPATAAPVTLAITASVLNLRASPDQGGAVLAKLRQGTRVTRLGASPDGAWLQVQAPTDGGTTTGWISAQYAAPAGAAAPSPAPAAAPKPAAAPVVSDGKEFAWITVAKRELGQHEVAGANNNPRIVEYHSATSLKATDDETPWCSAFANWCMKQVGIKGTGLANARSWLDWGRKIDTPVPGCVVVLKRTSSPTSGHVGFYMGPSTVTGRIQVLGGNQSDSVKLSNYPKTDVLGYRLPA